MSTLKFWQSDPFPLESGVVVQENKEGLSLDDPKTDGFSQTTRNELPNLNKMGLSRVTGLWGYISGTVVWANCTPSVPLRGDRSPGRLAHPGKTTHMSITPF